MKYSYVVLSLNPSYGGRWLSSSSSESTRPEFTGENAYDILGVSESSSLAEIKASFHKLAKQTHPDLAHHSNAFNSHRFIQILAAYEVLTLLLGSICYSFFLFLFISIVSLLNLIIYYHWVDFFYERFFRCVLEINLIVVENGFL